MCPRGIESTLSMELGYSPVSLYGPAELSLCSRTHRSRVWKMKLAAAESNVVSRDGGFLIGSVITEYEEFVCAANMKYALLCLLIRMMSGIRYCI